MRGKFSIALLYALVFTVYPPDNGKTQVKEVPDSVYIDEFDSAVIYEKEDAKADFKQVAESTRAIQRQAIRNLAIAEKKRKFIKVDTIFDTVHVRVVVDSPKHKGFFKRIFR